MEPATLPDGLRARLEALVPGARVARVAALADDESGGAGAQLKALGYGRPLLVELTDGRRLVFHTARADEFGHDRRADRVANLVLAYDTFGGLPHHVRALDVGLVRADGALASLADSHEPYLVTEWAPGIVYAEELERCAAAGAASPHDVARAEQLARVLLELHARPGSHPAAYTRAIRDLLGHGEGIFGLVDSYAPDTPGVSPARLRALEEACLAWRWRLRDRTDRLRRTHGDFHPFNLVCREDGGVALLDASRGSEGDPADDVACLALNYVFFGLHARAALAPVCDAFWRTYLAGAQVDPREAVAPYFAWRALVLASPRWYPHLPAADRERILAFAERALAAPRFEPAWCAEAMA